MIMATATGEAFGQALKELVVQDTSILVLDGDLSSATKTCYAKEARPQQFFSAGIAEANMVGMAAGLAAQGFKPFVSSFAMFLAGRAFEQIRNSVAYPRLNVKLCATHAGLTVGEDGASHQCNEDIALMRALPNMIVLQPCDDIETKAMMRFMASYEGPIYLRMSRYATERVFREPHAFQLGAIHEIQKGKRVAVLASGVMVSEAKQALHMLKKEHIEAGLYNVSTLKPFNRSRLREISRQYDLLITMEEHNVIGGLYSAVMENLAEYKRVLPLAVDDRFGESGTPKELMRKYGIDAAALIKVIKAVW